MLEHIGFSYDIANDGNEAIKKYKEAKENRPYSFVIMNLTIPSGMGGLKALEEIKNIDPKVKAIVSSGYSNDPIMAKYQDHGFRGRLPKPYTLPGLKRIVNNL